MTIPSKSTLQLMVEAIEKFDQTHSRPSPLNAFAPSLTQQLFMSARAEEQIIRELKPFTVTSDNPIKHGCGEFMGISYQVLDIPPAIELDWSDCRSPSRAKRRHARGIPQRVKEVRREVAYMVDVAAYARKFEDRITRMIIGK